MSLTQLEKAALLACQRSPRGCYDRPDTLKTLELKGLVQGMPGREGKTAYFLTEDGRKELKRG